ncbi:glycosyl hydrolase family 43 [Melghirimyces profundicolus]|uniref:Glycosyl hydrolase family 43 n=1 Tax=Melghirimyces profundicolus TaxID=1242148 RepID=A0A2T6C805_9BACL|nr:glycoside hydrolase family 43 protein [Melghirimyces profundicolus]PTX64432.1 glycosyl hydrolase family 43 [Melghirimyces profundicolus]
MTIIKQMVTLLLLVSLWCVPVAMAKGGDGCQRCGPPSGTFTNPIVDEDTPDPWVVYKDGFYYMTFTHYGKDIVVWKTRSLTDMRNAKKVTVWKPPTGTKYSHGIWAPELHWIDGKWYIYFAADDGSNPNHRMYVLESNTPNAQGSYTFKGKIADPKHDVWAIDGTVMKHNGNMYFVWSGWEHADSGFPQNLYISPMSNPWTISGERQMISTPTYLGKERQRSE